VEVYNYKGEVTNELNISARPLAATIENDIMYGVNINNEVFIFDIQAKSFIYKKRHTKVLTLDSKIAKPVVSDELVVIPTLDGKISIFDTKSNGFIRDIRVDGSTNFANATFLHIEGNILFCATKNRVVQITPKNFIEKNYLLKDVIYLDNFLYLFTVEGNIIKLDENLEEVASAKLKFARFSSAKVKNDDIYLIERTGYVVVLDKELNIKKTYEVAIDNEKILILDNMLYFGNKYKKLSL
jgi:outer membrane protein assembly factor BamB